MDFGVGWGEEPENAGAEQHTMSTGRRREVRGDNVPRHERRAGLPFRPVLLPLPWLLWRCLKGRGSKRDDKRTVEDRNVRF